MYNFDLAVIMLTDALMTTLPNRTDYLTVRELVRKKIGDEFKNIRIEMEENE